MMTQRPVTGSFLSSGIECVLKNLDHGTAGLEADRYNVEAARAAGQMVLEAAPVPARQRAFQVSGDQLDDLLARLGQTPKKN